MLPMKLYDHPRSGNCYKIRLMLSLLDLPYESEFVDVLGQRNHEPWFADINPLEQVPVLVDGEVKVQDSQAILVYLAGRYGAEWFASEPSELAAITEWLSFAAKEIAVGLQASRLYYIADEGIQIQAAQEEGRRVLAFLDRMLATRQWLALGRPTIADLACYPYVGLSREGRLPLDDHRHVLDWIHRIVALPRYVHMDGLPAAPRANSETL